MDAAQARVEALVKAAKDVDWAAVGRKAVADVRKADVGAAVWTGLACVGAASLASYFVPWTWQTLTHGKQDLKRKYKASWALVTGGSSGIGLALSNRLAQMGLNVVVAAYPDKTLDDAVAGLTQKYPAVQFRKVPVNLGNPDFLPALVQATADIDVQIVFNNAGYITTGFFTDASLERQLANHHCNATAGVQITHHFVSLMQKKKLRGCVGFTSSPAGFMPCPFSVIYGATKAFVTEFAQSIAPELYPDGIDVCVVHPSPVASAFYSGTHSIGALEFFRSTAVGPERIADAIIASMGRTVTCDQGYYPPVVKVLLKVLDGGFLSDIMTATAQTMPEFKKLKGVAAPKGGWGNRA